MIWGLEKIFNFMKLRILHIAPWRVSMSLQFLQYFSFSCWQFFSTGQIFSQEIQSLDIMLRSCASSRYNYTNRSLVDKADWVDLVSGSDQKPISTSISSCFQKSLKQSALSLSLSCVGVEGVPNWPPLLISVLQGPSWCLLPSTIDSSKMQSALGKHVGRTRFLCFSALEFHLWWFLALRQFRSLDLQLVDIGFNSVWCENRGTRDYNVQPNLTLMSTNIFVCKFYGDDTASLTGDVLLTSWHLLERCPGLVKFEVIENTMFSPP